MRISDWSSDVCSSDLTAHGRVADAVMAEGDAAAGGMIAERLFGLAHHDTSMSRQPGGRGKSRHPAAYHPEIHCRHGGHLSGWPPRIPRDRHQEIDRSKPPRQHATMSSRSSYTP